MWFVSLVKSWLHGRSTETSDMAKCIQTMDAGTLELHPRTGGVRNPCILVLKESMEVFLKSTRVTTGEKGHQDLQVSNLSLTCWDVWLPEDGLGMGELTSSYHYVSAVQICLKIGDTEVIQETGGNALPCINLC